MCTIGVVFENDTIYTFKQCDLIPKTEFNEPKWNDSTSGVKYLAMTRNSSNGERVWAGMNSAGVSFVAADAYTTWSNYYVTGQETEALFCAYKKIITSYTTASDAADYLCKFYETMGNKTPFPAPDISMISGYKIINNQKVPISIFIEYMPGPNNHTPIRTIERTTGFFCSTNNFRIQPESVSYDANHSTYLRLARAEAILQNDPSFKGIMAVLTDQYYGKNELSICRETQYIGQEFRTQATALFTVKANGQNKCHYQINGNPITNPLKEVK